MEDREEYDLMVPFTKESWHGRMRACRGVGASLSEEELVKWDREHRELLDRIAPEQFDVLHYAALAVLKKKTIENSLHGLRTILPTVFTRVLSQREVNRAIFT